MYATQKHALTEARQYERAPASVGSAASTFQQMAGQAGNQAMLALLGQRSEPAATGESLPNVIMQRFERKSGVPLDDVRVHYNSDKPDKFDAEAYARGNEIFIGPGNEQDLEHEVGHVVQQKMGQVRPTGIEHGFAVNRSPALEHGADVGAIPQTVGTATGPVVQCCGENTKTTSTAAAASIELSPDEKELFTENNFKGASISNKDGNNTVGSLYFKGTSLDELSLIKRIKARHIVKKYLEEKSALKELKKSGETGTKKYDEQKNKLHKRKVDLQKFFIDNDIKNGGRIRTTHDSAPEISQHKYILRMKDPREEKKGKLLEIFGDEKVDSANPKKIKINTHPSRGALVTTDTKGEAGDIVRGISGFSTKRFQKLAKVAKVAQNYYKPYKTVKVKRKNKLLLMRQINSLVNT